MTTPFESDAPRRAADGTPLQLHLKGSVMNGKSMLAWGTVSVSLIVVGGRPLPHRTDTPCKCLTGSRSLSSGDTKSGKWSRSVSPETFWL